MEFARLQAAKTTLTGLAFLGLFGGCSQAPQQPAHPAEAAGGPTQDYRPAPELLGGAPAAGGGLRLEGSAAPGAAVRLASPGGAAQFATADSHGAWRITIPPSAAPRFLGLSMSSGGQVVQAVSYLFVAPDGTVAKLRAGGGTEAPAPSGVTVAALALDYDNQHAATLSGVAAPQQTVALRVDGVERGQAVANAKGRFVLQLSQPLAVGPHDFDLADIGGGAEARFTVAIDNPAPLPNAPFAASRAGAGWRVDWVTPGGGEQTTLILGPPGGGRA
ncbi:MAG TPA: hypothetical protein VMT68_06145 [Caulobacteraceae bacterium]|nr:hypothetical protein [Caulobacteraceae bacterium]